MKWILYIATAALAAGGTLLWMLVSRYNGEIHHREKRQAIIVLGAAIKGEKPGPALKERLDYAYRLYSRGLAPVIICSGGSIKHRISEAEVMKQNLVEKGVPPDSILLEDRSTNTVQNIANTMKILKQHQWDDVYLVTHDYHMYRALFCARRYPVQVTPAPFHTRTLWMGYHKMRECLALIKYGVWYQFSQDPFSSSSPFRQK
ncbi:YdcF family protein [Paludifilum halophilum]|uniref:DUF218 domain-containing protein n=1 Tax=Paludifilum halophilum TaxID=1642702 RepID=A0A235B797_9BACL|nr:YdcF family protein [Paludifilum halophilum]OYD07475.1 hypothetical protein CHM34_11280 [Paludifilum halophilum]